MRRILAVIYGLAAGGTQLHIILLERAGASAMFDWFVLVPRSAALGLIWPLIWADHWVHFRGPISTVLAMR